MNNNFLCPECLSNLVLANNLVLSVKTSSGNRGIVFLSPKIGDYSLIKHHQFPMNEGETVEVRCPVCHADLRTNKVHNNLAKLVLADNNGKHSDIYFSGIVGEKCTFKVQEGKVTELHGDDHKKYLDFFNLCDMK